MASSLTFGDALSEDRNGCLTAACDIVAEHDVRLRRARASVVGCTLATCKPQIRARAQLGDCVMGTGCAKRGRSGRFVYMMRVAEITT